MELCKDTGTLIHCCWDCRTSYVCVYALTSVFCSCVCVSRKFSQRYEREHVVGHLLEHLEQREQMEQNLEHLFGVAEIGGKWDTYSWGVDR